MPAEFSRSIDAASGQVPALLEAIEAWLQANAVASAESARLMIAFDEILSNIAKYGGGQIEIELSLGSDSLSATILDDGPAFDPLGRPDPDTSLGIEDRTVGGLGIYLVREMMDEVSYSYGDGRNRLTFRKTF